jgi:hypothetical protein
LFASTGFDVYRSTDKGGTWLSSSACCGAGLGVSPDYTHDQTVFALGSQDGLLYRSTNGGTNWTKAAQPGLSPALWAISPQYTPGHGITIWAAAKVSSSGPVGQLARSSDGATTWSTAVEVNRSHYPMAIAFSPAFDTDGTALAATEAGSPSGTYAGFYATTTGGTTWPISGLWSPCTQANGCPDNGSAAAFSPDYKSDQTAFVGTLSDGVWRTTNGVGGSLAKGVFPVPRTVQNLVVSPTFSTDELVWAGTAGAGIFVSSSRGQTWSAFNTGLADLRVNSLAASPAFAADKTLLAATDSGLWAYTYGSGPRRVYLPRVTSP